MPMSVLAGIGLFLLTLALMEGFAYVMHRWVMHSRLGWFLHESHHRERTGRFELNDLYAVIFAVPSILLIYGGAVADWGSWAVWVGAGVAAYGAVYFGFHDVIVHRRVAHRVVPRSTYFKRIVQAHRIHHAVEAREGHGELRLPLCTAGREAEGRAGGQRSQGHQGAPGPRSAERGRVHRPSRRDGLTGHSASQKASITNAAFSAFEVVMRLSQARGPSASARVATSP